MVDRRAVSVAALGSAGVAIVATAGVLFFTDHAKAAGVTVGVPAAVLAVLFAIAYRAELARFLADALYAVGTNLAPSGPARVPDAMRLLGVVFAVGLTVLLLGLYAPPYRDDVTRGDAGYLLAVQIGVQLLTLPWLSRGPDETQFERKAARAQELAASAVAASEAHRQREEQQRREEQYRLGFGSDEPDQEYGRRRQVRLGTHEDSYAAFERERDQERFRDLERRRDREQRWALDFDYSFGTRSFARNLVTRPTVHPAAISACDRVATTQGLAVDSVWPRLQTVVAEPFMTQERRQVWYLGIARVLASASLGLLGATALSLDHLGATGPELMILALLCLVSALASARHRTAVIYALRANLIDVHRVDLARRLSLPIPLTHAEFVAASRTLVREAPAFDLSRLLAVPQSPSVPGATSAPPGLDALYDRTRIELHEQMSELAEQLHASIRDLPVASVGANDV